MTGLLGGGHAIYFDAASGTVRNLDCFVSVPSGSGAADGIAAASSSARSSSTTRSAHRRARCPGSPPGSTRSGARTAAAVGATRRAGACGSHARASRCRRRTSSCLAMLEPVMTMREGAAIYAPGGRLLARATSCRSRDSYAALELVRDEGATSVYTGSIARSPARAGRRRGGVGDRRGSRVVRRGLVGSGRLRRSPAAGC